MSTMTWRLSWIPRPVLEKRILRRSGNGWPTWWSLSTWPLTRQELLWFATVTDPPLSSTSAGIGPWRRSSELRVTFATWGEIQWLGMLSATPPKTSSRCKMEPGPRLEAFRRWPSFSQMAGARIMFWSHLRRQPRPASGCLLWASGRPWRWSWRRSRPSQRMPTSSTWQTSTPSTRSGAGYEGGCVRVSSPPHSAPECLMVCLLWRACLALNVLLITLDSYFNL